MSVFNELVKQRILAGNLDKPEMLYPLLLEELAVNKAALINWLKLNCEGDSILDVGGGNGEMIKGSHFNSKVVIDKRCPKKRHPDLIYVICEYKDDFLKQDTTLFSEFLHLFPMEKVEQFIDNCKSREIIVVENKYDDFLDLRLRLWSNGACINEDDMSDIMGSSPVFSTDKYNLWRTIK